MARRFRTYRYALHPTAAQSNELARAAGARRFVYNWALQQWRAYYGIHRRSPTRAELCRALTELKHSPGQEWMLEISSSLMQQAIVDVWRAYRSFFAGRSGYPRFRSKKRDRLRFRYPAGARLSDDRVFLPRIGWVHVRMSRPFVGKLKSVTVKHRAGRWFVLALAEFEVDDQPVVLSDPAELVGIDLGVTHLATLSDGAVIHPPRFAIRDASSIRRASRALQRTKRGSRNRLKRRRRLAKLHARIADRRRDFLHKLTTSVAAEYGGFCVETLDVRGLARSKLSRAVLDAGLGEFLRQLEYKADWRRKPFVAVGRFYPSTKTCGACGTINAALTRSDRRWRCRCGAVHDRDLNAARNIRDEGLRLLVAAGHADTSNARGAQVRPPIEAPGDEAGTPKRGCQTGSILVGGASTSASR